MAIIGWVVITALAIFQWVLICRAVLSWVQMFNPQWQPRGLLLVVAEATYTVTDPPLRGLRKLIKPLRIGGVHLDMAFLVLLILVIIAQRLATLLFF
jgi:YggT family protein